MAEDKYQEIVVAEEWTEVAVAEPEVRPLADEVARLAEERGLTETAAPRESFRGEKVTASDDGWGELGRMAGIPIPGIGDFDVLGDLMAKSPAFQQYVAKRAAASRPVVRKVPLQKARDWQLPLGPAYGEAGTVTTLTVSPRTYFRCEKPMATDTAETAGTGTLVGTILVGRRLQRPATDGWTPTTFFGPSALGGGYKWDTCQPSETIAVSVSFVQSCTFYMDLFGKAVI